MFTSIRRLVAACLIGSAGLLMLAPASAATYSNGLTTTISSFGPTESPNYGQVFTLTTARSLRDWTFYVYLGSGGSVRFVVANWDGSRPVGPALYTATGSYPGGRAALPFPNINLDLTAGTYIAYVTVAGVPAAMSGAFFGGSKSNGGLAGNVVYLNTRGVDPLTVADRWQSISDLSLQYTATFSGDSLPENLACARASLAAVPVTSPTVAAQLNVISGLINNVLPYSTQYRSLSVSSLDQAIARTDGCALRGSVDGLATQGAAGADFIPSCAAQAPIYACLRDARSQLTAP